MSESWTTYAVRCADGEIRHYPERPTVRDLALQTAHKLIDKECGPHTIVQATVTKSDYAPMDEAVPDLQAKRHAAVTTSAHTIRCPACLVEVGKPCENLIARATGSLVYTAWPHASRIEAVMRSTP